jgi:hypothetical protein
VAEGVRGCGARLLPGPVADEDALVVVEFSVGGGGGGDRDVGERDRPGGGQAAARFGGTEQDVGQGSAALLSREPAEQHRGDLVAPGKLHRGAGVDDHDGVGVDRGDGPHQVVLAPGEPQVGAVEALGLDAFGGADHDDRGVRGSGRFDGLGDQLVGVTARAEVAEGERDAGDG